MPSYEYKIVPAPRRARRYKGVRGGAESFARTLEETIAAEAVDGWEYHRADSLPCEEKKGFLRGREDSLHSVLVFRRSKPPIERGPRLRPPAEREEEAESLRAVRRDAAAKEPTLVLDDPIDAGDERPDPDNPRLGPAR